MATSKKENLESVLHRFNKAYGIECRFIKIKDVIKFKDGYVDKTKNSFFFEWWHKRDGVQPTVGEVVPCYSCENVEDAVEFVLFKSNFIENVSDQQISSLEELNIMLDLLEAK